ncbi:hypothetical protein ABZP36_017075 [Zizania latifolia]
MGGVAAPLYGERVEGVWGSAVGNKLPPVPAYVPPTALIPSSRFLIDAFRYAGEFTVAYFHSDHDAGLGPSWSRGLVFCSAFTARLLVSVLSVPRQLIVVSAGYWIAHFSKGDREARTF